MIITAGEFRGRKIDCPAGKNVRPTSSKTRQAVFNVLYSMDFDIRGIHMLELFAGTGIMSFEAVSRGANSSTLVENAIDSIRHIEKNALNLKIKDKLTIVKHDALDFVKNGNLKKFNLVYMDPPYKYESYMDVLKELASHVNKDAVIMAESDRAIIEENNNLGLEALKTKKWGKTLVTFLRTRS